MKIAIGADHAGFQYKERLILFLIELGHEVQDFGTHSEEPVDYPPIIAPVARAVAEGEFDRGIVLGASGNGEAMTANRFGGIRCSLCWNRQSARLARQHNDANMLALGQRMMDYQRAQLIVETWLETPFEGGRHRRRIRLIDRVRNNAPVATAGSLPRRTPMTDHANYTCDSCREDFPIAVDLSAGTHQEYIEECPVCCHANLIHLEIDADGTIHISGQQE